MEATTKHEILKLFETTPNDTSSIVILQKEDNFSFGYPAGFDFIKLGQNLTNLIKKDPNARKELFSLILTIKALLELDGYGDEDLSKSTNIW